VLIIYTFSLISKLNMPNCANLGKPHPLGLEEERERTHEDGETSET